MCFHGKGPWKLPHAVPHGFLKFFILKLISEKPRHGYEIMGEVEKRTDGYWRPSAGSIYPTLMWLESKGLIEEVPGIERERRYKITEDGKKTLERYMSRIEELSDRAFWIRAFWRDLLRESVMIRMSIRGLELSLQRLKEVVKFASEKDLIELENAIEKLKKDIENLETDVKKKLKKETKGDEE